MPFIIYADFESLLKKPRDNDHKNICQIHQAFSVGYYLKCSYNDQLSYYRSYRGPKPAKWFVQELAEFSTFTEATFKNVKLLLPLTPEEQKAYDDATTCHIFGVILKFIFIDTFKFMNSSLDKLSSYLQKHDTLRSQFSGLSDELIALLCRKGVFAYNYIDCLEKLDDTVLPPIE